MLKFSIYSSTCSSSAASGAKTKPEVFSQAYDTLMSRKDLGFFQLPARDENWLNADKFAKDLRARGSHLVVIGLGGSALGGRCLVETLANQPNKFTVEFLLNTDPVAVDLVLGNEQKIEKSQFLVISKSGNTLEIACLLDILLQKLNKIKRPIKDAISVITEDTANPLNLWAKENQLSTLAHPKDVGGRFSVFTPVGLAPASFAGIDIHKLRVGAQAVNKNFVNEMAQFYLESFLRKESLSIFWNYVEKLNSFSSWLVQLWAESLAKKSQRASQSLFVSHINEKIEASTPISYFGTCDQHSVLQQLMEGSKNKSICFVRSEDLSTQGECFSGVGLKGFEYLKSKVLGEVFHTQSLSTQMALAEAGHTTVSIEMSKVTEASLGELLMSFQLLIGVLGECLNINAFVQSGVELGKKITKEKLTQSSRL